MNNDRIEILTKRIINGLLSTGRAEMSLFDEGSFIFEGAITLDEDGIAFEDCNPDSSIQFADKLHAHLTGKFDELKGFVEQSESAS